MSQRNPQNARYTHDKPKGVTRKSAGSAKPKKAAGSSVYTLNKEQKKKQEEKKTKDKAKEMQRDLRTKETLTKAEKNILDYQKHRRLWLIFIVLAVIGIVVSWGGGYMMEEGKALEFLIPWRTYFVVGGMILGYAAIIIALIVDFKFIRPIRKAGSMVAKESKKQAKHADEEPKRGLFGRKK